MTHHGLPQAARAGAGWLVALLGFAIPVSVAFDAVVTALVVLAWLIAAPASFIAYARTLRTLRPVLIAWLLFALLLLSTVYAPVPWKSAWGSASKYLDLALIPVFAWAAGTPEVRVRALYAFLTAIALSLIVSYGTAVGLWSELPGLHNFPDYPVGFKLSVTHNLLVAFAGFVLLLLARELRRRGARRGSLAALGFALLCIFNVLFVVIGRSGYLVLGALLVYLAYTAVRGRRGLLIAALAIVALFASAYMGSGYFVARVQDVAWDLAQWKSGANDDTSVGHRLVYYGTTLEIVREHPLTGVGAGGFAQAYADKVRGTPARTTVNPHNDYLMIAAQAGLPALALLLSLYVLLWRDAQRLGSAFERDAMRGLVLTVAIGGLFNSLLMDHVEGLLFAWTVGVLYGSRACAPGDARVRFRGAAALMAARPPAPPRLSAIVITKNEAPVIARCIESLAFADEIVVVDSGSTDATADICRGLGAQVHATADWPGFGPQKNRALAHARGEWVISLDSDEWVTPALKDEIERTIASKDGKSAYAIPRQSSFCGRVMKHSGWWPDHVLRLFRRDAGRFSDDRTHERVLVDGPIGRLREPIMHEAITSLEQMLLKMNAYSSTSAAAKREQGGRATVLTAIVHGGWTFFRTYVLRLGFLDGREGFMLAVANAEGSYYRYLKLMLLERK